MNLVFSTGLTYFVSYILKKNICVFVPSLILVFKNIILIYNNIESIENPTLAALSSIRWKPQPLMHHTLFGAIWSILPLPSCSCTFDLSSFGEPQATINSCAQQ